MEEEGDGFFDNDWFDDYSDDNGDDSNSSNNDHLPDHMFSNYDQGWVQESSKPEWVSDWIETEFWKKTG